ncbi:uncharacterized protein LOC108864746 [Galendromus occidentalis]|uniref:Uncharacterized protein LOC108864746 n=1 Tax=Galendromus occidentalis TaxID=34638 RepID=A0AAJ7L5N7_9ACAR|nr:uncharacterized protein LOC108864746 [Galendromus occidentalis]
MIRSTSGALPRIIQELESNNMPLVDAVNLIDDFKTEFLKIRRGRLVDIRDKLSRVFNKNEGLKELRAIALLLQGDVSDNSAPLSATYSSDERSRFKSAPFVSLEVGRSFSRYKAFLSDNRRGFEF